MAGLAFPRVSQIDGCACCIGMHSRDLTHEGSAVEKLLLVPVWHEAGRLFAKQVQAALASAESVTRVADGHAPEADFAADRAVFTGKELADLASPSGS